MLVYCKSCGAVFEDNEAIQVETNLPCPCGCGGHLVMLACPRCGSTELTQWVES